MKTVYVLGEAMLELAPSGEDSYRLGVAGDTFNTAVGLAQLGCPVQFLSGLGTDPGSMQIREACAQWKISDKLIAALPDRNPGLYMIHTDESGERSFSYWRDESAAHELFSRPEELAAVLAQIETGQWIYLSGITLAIASAGCRSLLNEFLADYRDRGGRVAFDCNHRSALWPDTDQAADCYSDFLQTCDLFFAGEDDLNSAWNLETQNMLPFLESLGIETTLLKRGGASVLLMTEGEVREVDTELIEGVIDSTGAGDAFTRNHYSPIRRSGGLHPQ